MSAADGTFQGINGDYEAWRKLEKRMLDMVRQIRWEDRPNTQERLQDVQDLRARLLQTWSSS